MLPLQLKNEDISKHNSIGEFKSVCSVFEHPNDTKLRFYIHPELVESSSTSNIFSVKLCSTCVNSLRKKKIPKPSIADGYDYGRIERLLHMQSLTFVEKHLIALVRLHITEVKLVDPLGDSITAIGSSSLIGYIICFPQDGPKAAAARLLNPETFPWLDDILDTVNVTFIGTDKKYDRYMKHAFLLSRNENERTSVFFLEEDAKSNQPTLSRHFH